MNIDSQTENSNDQYEFDNFIKNREAKVLGSKTQIFSDTKSMKVAPTAAMTNQVAPFNQRDGYTEFNDANEQSEIHIPNVGLESPDHENTASKKKNVRRARTTVEGMSTKTGKTGRTSKSKDPAPEVQKASGAEVK